MLPLIAISFLLRRQSEGLSRVVWLGSDLRAARHAILRHSVLQSGDGFEVCITGRNDVKVGVLIPLRRPYDCRMWSALATVYEHLKRVPEAIQCNNRALLGADAGQTLGILLKLAQLYDSMGQHADAADAHRRHIMLAEREERDAGEIAQSYLYVAQFDMGLLHRDRETAEEGDGTKTGASDDGKDVKAAVFMLEKVIASDAPEKEAAEEDLRFLRKKYGDAIDGA